MARTKKTWQQKLADAKAKPGLPKKWYCHQARMHMVVPSPAEVEQIIRRVRKGRLITIKQIGELLKARHGVDMAVSGMICALLQADAMCGARLFRGAQVLSPTRTLR